MSEDKIILDSTIFWVFAVLSVSSALGLVLHRSIIYAALLLIVVFMSIAGLFVLNNADFLAISQTIVYAVGLTIIMIFGVMFTGDRTFEPTNEIRNRHRAYWLVALFAGSTIFYGTVTMLQRLVIPFWSKPIGPDMVVELQRNGSTNYLGKVLFSTYALPFEVASVLLLVALVGAIVLAKKRFELVEDTLGETKFELNVESELNPEAEAEYETQYKQLIEHPLNKKDSDDVSDESSEMAGVK